MPSMEDLQKVMDGRDAMGAAYIPFTFPTVTVRNNMAIAGVLASNAEVDRMWEAYYSATVEDGLAPFRDPKLGGNTPILLAVEKKTGFERLKVAAWLNAVYKAVNEQNMGWRWLDPKASDHAEQGAIKTVTDTLTTAARGVGEAAGALLKPSLDPVTNLVKYTAIAVAAGALVYGVYQGMVVYKSFRRVKRRKKGG